MGVSRGKFPGFRSPGLCDDSPQVFMRWPLWLHKKRAGHAPSTFNCRVKPAFLLTHELSFPVGLAPLPALSPHRCKQSWYNARGEGLRGEGSCRFYATLGFIQAAIASEVIL